MKPTGMYAIAVVTLVCGFLFAESKQEKGGVLLERCARTSLNAAGAVPYRMQAYFTFARPGSEPVPGTYKLIWIAPDRWRHDIDVGNLQEVVIGEKNRKWLQRTLDVQPLLDRRLNVAIGYLQDLRLDPTDLVTKISEQKRNGAKLQCVTYKGAVGLERTVCFDEQTGVLASVRDGLWEFDYSDPEPFGTRPVPRQIRISDEGKLRIEAQIRHIDDPGVVEADFFTPPSHAQEWADCDKPVAGKYISKVAPKYPEQARQAHHEGTVVLYNVIAADGSLENIKVIQTAGALLDDAAMIAVKQWKYAPTTCDGIPIRIENELQINFTLSY